MRDSTYIIAEIGCNHCGDPVLARRMVEEAVRTGVDAVKFQAFRAVDLISRFAPKARYQVEATGEGGSQLEMTRALELPWEEIDALIRYAKSLGIDAFSTPFDLGSVAFLEGHGQRVWKVPSGEVTDLPYLEAVGAVEVPGKRVLLSTGMCTVCEVAECLRVLEAAGNDPSNVTLLHCNTEYPTPDRDVNVSAVATLREAFPGHEVGLSDHSVGPVAAIMAVVLGARVVEKHFTLDRSLPGPDQRASATPEELAELVRCVRRAEKMLGDGRKAPTLSERQNIVAARRSIVAARDIEEGEEFDASNLACKRPGNGISPMMWREVVGRRAQRAFVEDELIVLDGVPWQG